MADRASDDGGPHDPAFHFQGPPPRLEAKGHGAVGCYLHGKFCSQPPGADVPDHPRDLLPGELFRPSEYG